MFLVNCQKLKMAFVAFVGGSFTSLALTWDRSVYEAFH